jgi:DNA-directed RNA polymerase specialized sigma24 family protein
MLKNEPALDDPVTVWIDQLKNADDSAAEKLWNHFVIRLYESARSKLQPNTRAVYDEEDAVQSAFHSVCAGVVAGRFPDLRDRDSLWKLMLVITSRKVARRHRYDQRQRRDVGRTLSNLVFKIGDSDFGGDPMHQLASREPAPEFAAEFVETCESLFQCLDDPQLQQVVSLRMEGYDDSEIAQRLNRSRRTVQRCLEVVRRQWKRQELSLE